MEVEPKPKAASGVLKPAGGESGLKTMQRLSKRELAILFLCVGLGIGWCWDHVRCAAMRSRAEKSEQYFRQQLFERWGDKGDEAKRPPVPKPGQQN